jgi:hypothetical protein
VIKNNSKKTETYTKFLYPVGTATNATLLIGLYYLVKYATTLIQIYKIYSITAI